MEKRDGEREWSDGAASTRELAVVPFEFDCTALIICLTGMLCVFKSFILCPALPSATPLRYGRGRMWEKRFPPCQCCWSYGGL